MLKQWSRTLAVLVAVLAIGLLWASLSTAGKPPPPPSPPPADLGTIYFHWGGNWQMASDGSAKSLVFDAPLYYEPSGMDYGGYRWWLTVYDDGSGEDVYAVHPDGAAGDWDWVRLTDFAKDGITFGGDSGLGLRIVTRWSSDGNDSFVSAVGHDAAGNHYIWRIGISGYEIDAHSTDPVMPVTLDDLRLTAMVVEPGPINGGYAVSPDGTKVVYQTLSDVRIKRLPAGPVSYVPLRGERFDWSPDGTKITFTVKPSVLTMNADGTGVTTVAQGTPGGAYGNGSPGYLQSFWSPDGNWLVFRRELYTKGKFWSTQCDVVAMPAGGGQMVNLTGEVDRYSWKLPLAWRPQ